MIFERTMICSVGTPYSIYFRMVANMSVCAHVYLDTSNGLDGWIDG